MSSAAREPIRIDRSTPDGALVRTVTGTFFGVPRTDHLVDLDAQVAFLGVPFDARTPQPGNRTGHAAGPEAVRRSSRDQFDYGADASLGWHDVEAGRDRLVGVTMADVGGDHAVSFPLVRGIEPVGEVDVVHLDAHAAFYDDLDGARHSGASEMRRIRELPFVRSVTALGIRNVDRVELAATRELDVRWTTALDMIEGRGSDVVADLVPHTQALYVSIDLDALDISLTPGRTLPEPGGLDNRQLRAALDQIARRGKVVGFDVVELNPALDAGEVTARTAAWLITHFLSEIFEPV